MNDYIKTFRNKMIKITICKESWMIISNVYYFKNVQDRKKDMKIDR